MRRFVFLMTVVTIAGMSAARSFGASDVTSFQSSRPGEYVVAVMVNGQGPFAFILDTGSSHSFIAESLAQKLGAPAVAKSLVRSSIGLAMRAIVRLDRVTLGPTVDSGVLASLVPGRNIDSTGRIVGIIGQDVLASRRYTIDFANRRVIWHLPDDALPSGRVSFPLRPANGRFLVELVQRDSSRLRLIPDSGAEGLVLYQRDHTQLPPLIRSPGRIRMNTLTSEADVQPIRVSELQVGPTNFVDLPAVLIEQHGTPGLEGDGLLPLHWFKRVTFDGPARRLSVE